MSKATKTIISLLKIFLVLFLFLSLYAYMMMGMPLSAYLFALIATLIIEVVVASILKFFRSGELKGVIAVNFISHTILHYLFYVNGLYDWIAVTFAVVIFLEVLVVFLEWGLLSYIFSNRKKLFLFVLALLMNAISFAIGWFVLDFDSIF